MALPGSALVAHSSNSTGVEQGLVEHLKQVADKAREFAATLGDGDMAGFVGSLHDIGKSTTAWQGRLQAISNGHFPKFNEIDHDHKISGALYAWSLDTPAGRLAALPIAGHHLGIPNMSGLGQHQRSFSDEVRSGLRAAHVAEIKQKLGDFLATLDEPRIPGEWQSWSLWQKYFYIVRIFSCLVDADSIDTGEHFGHRVEVPAVRTMSQLQTHMVRRFEAMISTVGVSPKVAAMRQRILNDSIRAASISSAAFSLNSPTGSGKTLASIQFAVRHAAKFEKQRIVYVAPFRTVLDQTGDTYSRLFGRKNVLIHHSTADFWSRDERDDKLRRQVAENYEGFPIICTTPEQIFESLFSTRPGAARKIHNLYNCVLLIDEPQALPLKVLEPVFQALRYLAQDFRCTLVFLTATLPPVSALLRMPVHEIVSDTKKEFRLNRRVRVFKKQFEGVDPFVVADFMAKETQGLAISNTRTNAYAIFSELPPESRVYFSTYMCPLHRRSVLNKVRVRLKVGERLHVSATQAMEAGVDLNFPTVVMREKCPLDSGMQTAGRCNRNGTGSGRFYWFSFKDGNKLADYNRGIECLDYLYRRKLSPHDPATMRMYYDMLYESRDLDTKKIADSVKHFAFENVRNDFHVLDNIQLSLVVRYGTRRQKSVLDWAVKTMHIGSTEHATRDERRNIRRAIRYVQPFVVPVYKPAFEKLENENLIEEIGAGYFLFRGEYDEEVGLARAVL